MLPGAKSVDSATEYNVFGGLVPRPPEWYYPQMTTVGRALRWHDKPWEIQSDRGLPLRQLPSEEAKASPSPKS